MNIIKPNIHQIQREAELLFNEAKTLNTDRTPPGIKMLDKAIDLSRLVHKGEMTYEEAEEKLTTDEVNLFQWKPFSEKQIAVIDAATSQDPSWILLLEGAVRSGKTISGTAAWLKFIQKSSYPRHLLTGKTKDTLYRNILSDLFDVLGEGYYYFNKSEGILKFMGKTIWCLGANDERSESRFRGPTVASWYGDEVTTYPNSVMKMAISRPSIPGAIVMWTTNPDSPYHPLYQEYMVNQEMAKKNQIKVFHFRLDDNLTLDNRYKENLKASYSGIFYDRFIEGLWTIAEGAVYDMFVESQHTFPANQAPFDTYDYYTVGIDYGTSSVCCFTLMGVKIEAKRDYHYHFLKEWYYDAKLARKTKPDGEYSKDLTKFISDSRLPVSRVFIPHDAASLGAKLREDGFTVGGVSPDVVNELKMIGELINNGKILISQDCVNLLKQMVTYVWDDRAQLAGFDAPLKRDDHAVDSMRYNIVGWLRAPKIPDLRLVVSGRPSY